MKHLLLLATTLLTVANCDVVDPAPRCASDLQIHTPQELARPDTITFGSIGATAWVVSYAATYTCSNPDRSVKYLSRNPQVVSVSRGRSGDIGDLRATGAGQTYVVAQLLADGSARDSVKVIVLPELELVVLSGSTLSDTIDAVMRDSLIVMVRERASGRPIPNLGLQYFVEYAGTTVKIVLPNGTEGNYVSHKTDAGGRAAVAVRASRWAGNARISVRAYCLKCVGFAPLAPSVAPVVTVRPGAPHTVSFDESNAVLIGEPRQLSVSARDRRNNLVGPIAGTFEVVSGSEIVAITQSGVVTGIAFGTATILATTSLGTRNFEITSFPAREVAGVHNNHNYSYAGGLAIGRLDGSKDRDVGAVFVASGGMKVDWSPHGTLILLDGIYPGAPLNTRHLFIARLDGTSEPLLPSLRDSAGEFGGRFSPDGQYAYFSKRNELGGAEIWRARLSDRSFERVGPVRTREVDQYPSFSNDGRYMAFIHLATPGGIGDALIMDLLTGTIEDTGIDAAFIEFSPTDNTLAVVVPHPSDGFQLRLLDRNGMTIRELEHFRGTADHRAASFDWSPDGKYILTNRTVFEVATGKSARTKDSLVRRSWRPR